MAELGLTNITYLFFDIVVIGAVSSRLLVISEPNQRSKMEFFSKMFQGF